MEAIYKAISAKAIEIENELKRVNRWQELPMPKEKFIDMGSFGSRTMAFEQWIQFVLLPRIQKIVSTRGELPKESSLAVYAARTFDGDPKSESLQNLLNDIDTLINKRDFTLEKDKPINLNLKLKSETTSIDATTIPSELYEIARLLPLYEGESLEAQLQTFDIFLEFLSPTARLAMSEMILSAAKQTENQISKARIEQAGQDVKAGKRAAEKYDHAEAMRKYQEDHKKSFPS
ncbi:MAG: YqcC family protein [Cyclobacteriaceae bacterium]|nr:YqcC family protein [Cyclobacteriaceae bacterium]